MQFVGAWGDMPDREPFPYTNQVSGLQGYSSGPPTAEFCSHTPASLPQPAGALVVPLGIDAGDADVGSQACSVADVAIGGDGGRSTDSLTGPCLPDRRIRRARWAALLSCLAEACGLRPTSVPTSRKDVDTKTRFHKRDTYVAEPD